MAGINDHKKGPKPKIYSKEDLYNQSRKLPGWSD